MPEVTLDKTGAPHSAIERIHLVNACPLLSPTDKAVLNYVGLRHNAKMGYAFASVNDIAQQTGFVTRTITRVFQRLGKIGLLQRSYRDNDPTQSMATVINWGRLHEVRVVTEPWDGTKKKGKIKKETATETREEDQKVADTLDVSTGPASERVSTRSELDIVNETKTLLTTHFGDHPTFGDTNANKMIYECIWFCVKQAESPEYALAVFQWVCTDPANENLRGYIRASGKLGGFIKKCFKGWAQEFIAADQVNHPYYEQCLTELCGGDEGMHFSEEHLAFVQPFRAWLEAQVGEHLLDLEITTDEDGSTLRVEIDDEFKAARLLEFQDSEQPNS